MIKMVIYISEDKLQTENAIFIFLAMILGNRQKFLMKFNENITIILKQILKYLKTNIGRHTKDLHKSPATNILIEKYFKNVQLWDI